MSHKLRLGLNIDHVATLRNARGGAHPDPVRAARIAAAAGVDGITVHLREDRRHIRDDDVKRLMDEIDLPLNLEMAATREMLAIALALKPHACCIVPESREERTTEGGLNAAGLRASLAHIVTPLRNAGIRVSLFIEPEPHQLDAAQLLGAPAVELHTGAYAGAQGAARAAELRRLDEAAREGASRGLEIHAGHGLDFDNVTAVARIDDIVELNIGHHIIGEAVFGGLKSAIHAMRAQMNAGRRHG